MNSVCSRVVLSVAAGSIVWIGCRETTTNRPSQSTAVAVVFGRVIESEDVWHENMHPDRGGRSVDAATLTESDFQVFVRAIRDSCLDHLAEKHSLSVSDDEVRELCSQIASNAGLDDARIAELIAADRVQQEFLVDYWEGRVDRVEAMDELYRRLEAAFPDCPAIGAAEREEFFQNALILFPNAAAAKRQLERIEKEPAVVYLFAPSKTSLLRRKAHRVVFGDGVASAQGQFDHSPTPRALEMDFLLESLEAGDIVIPEKALRRRYKAYLEHGMPGARNAAPASTRAVSMASRPALGLHASQ